MTGCWLLSYAWQTCQEFFKVCCTLLDHCLYTAKTNCQCIHSTLWCAACTPLLFRSQSPCKTIVLDIWSTPFALGPPLSAFVSVAAISSCFLALLPAASHRQISGDPFRCAEKASPSNICVHCWSLFVWLCIYWKLPQLGEGGPGFGLTRPVRWALSMLTSPSICIFDLANSLINCSHFPAFSAPSGNP